MEDGKIHKEKQMKLTTLIKTVLFALLISGCGTSEIDHWIKAHNDPCDLGMIDCDNNTTANSADTNLTTIDTTTDSNLTETENNTTTETNDNNTTNIIADNNITDQNLTQNSVIVDPNACSSTFSAIEDDNNEPQGVTKDGITFTSTLVPSSIKEIFYYEPQTIQNLNNNSYLGEFKDNDGNVKFTLSINEAYYGKGYFYVRNGSNGKCYRGEFPLNELTPPTLVVVEVVEK